MTHRVFVSILLASGVVCGCSLVDPPTPIPVVETFRVNLALVSNSCGFGGLALQSVNQLDGVLRGYAGQTATWEWTSLGGAATGTSNASGMYQFVDVTSFDQVPADVTSGYAGCVVTQRTELNFTVVPVPTAPVDAGSIDASLDGSSDGGGDASLDAGTVYRLTGTMRIDVTPTSTSDCSPLLGTWEAIPCHAVLDVTGVPAP